MMEVDSSPGDAGGFIAWLCRWDHRQVMKVGSSSGNAGGFVVMRWRFIG